MRRILSVAMPCI